jgi:hypothetical protein
MARKVQELSAKPDKNKRLKLSWLTRENLIYITLIGISISAPLVSYAGVSLIYPNSTMTSDVVSSPPITWTQGADYAAASALGFAGSFAQTNNAGSFTLTVSGLSGGTVTIDKLVNVVADSGVATYKIQITTALDGTLDPEPTTLKLRFWTGGTAPTGDGSAGVITVLDLKSALDTETAATIAGDESVFVQLVYQLASSTTGSSTVSIAPSSITTS